jgi:hypothetical protein
MNTLGNLFMFILMVSMGLSVQALEHQHGAGQRLISQAQKQWHVQFILPAVDALVFEHSAKTLSEKEMVNKPVLRIEQNRDVVELARHCSKISVKHSLLAVGAHSDDEHQGIHSFPESHHDHDSQEAHHEKHQYKDIEVKYQFNCESAVNRVAVKFFKSMPLLSQIQALWIHESSQGMVQLTRNQSIVA